MLCPESRKTSRGSPTAQGKNWLWKRKLTRCAGSPTTPERKNALPVLHGRSEGDFPRFRVTPRQGNAEIRQIIPADAFGSRENSAQAGSTAGRIFRQKVSPRRNAPRTRQEEKSPEKIWQEEGKFPSMACALPFPLRSRNMPRSRGMCGTSVCRKKTPPRRKACCGTCRCTGGSREKISTGP